MGFITMPRFKIQQDFFIIIIIADMMIFLTWRSFLIFPIFIIIYFIIIFHAFKVNKIYCCFVRRFLIMAWTWRFNKSKMNWERKIKSLWPPNYSKFNQPTTSHGCSRKLLTFSRCEWPNCRPMDQSKVPSSQPCSPKPEVVQSLDRKNSKSKFAQPAPCPAITSRNQINIKNFCIFYSLVLFTIM